jgi:prolyl oligopeptidase
VTDDRLFGLGWAADLGSPGEPEDFARIRGYSPYQNLRPGTGYPAALAATGDDDDAAVVGEEWDRPAEVQVQQSTGIFTFL